MTQEPDRESGRTDLPADLPVWETVVGAYRSVFVEHSRHLPRALCVPFLLSLLLTLLALHVTEFGMVRPASLPDLGIALLWRAAFAMPFVIFAVSWHRLILFGPGEGRPPLWPALGARHLSFYGYVVVAALIYLAFTELLAALGIALLIAALPPGFDFEIGLFVELLCGLAASYIVVRICFVFPAAAADRAYPLADAWADSEAVRWPLFGATFLVALPYALFRMLFSFISDGNEPLSMPGAASATSWQELAAVLMANEALIALAGYLTAALGISLISQTFMKRIGWKAPSGNASPQSEPEPPPPEQKPA